MEVFANCLQKQVSEFVVTKPRRDKPDLSTSIVVRSNYILQQLTITAILATTSQQLQGRAQWL